MLLLATSPKYISSMQACPACCCILCCYLQLLAPPFQINSHAWVLLMMHGTINCWPHLHHICTKAANSMRGTHACLYMALYLIIGNFEFSRKAHLPYKITLSHWMNLQSMQVCCRANEVKLLNTCTAKAKSCLLSRVLLLRFWFSKITAGESGEMLFTVRWWFTWLRTERRCFSLNWLSLLLLTFTDDFHTLFLAVNLSHSGSRVPRVVHKGKITSTGEQGLETMHLEIKGGQVIQIHYYNHPQ